jgi:HlyD family secretion protein
MANWSARLPVALGMAAVAVLVGGVGWWGATQEIAGAVVAPGQIEVEQNRQVVQHPDGGVVAEIAVREGDSVAAGDLLIRLDGSLLSSDLAVTEGQLFELMARKARLQAERDDAERITFDAELVAAAAANPDYARLTEGQQRLFDARRESLARQMAQLGQQSEQIASQVRGIEAQIQAIARQSELVAQELDSQQKLLDRGLAQMTQVLALKRQAADLTGRRGELAAARAQAGEKIAEIEIQKEQLRTRRIEDAITSLRDLSYNEIQLSEKRRQLREKIGRLEIRAPVSGVVYGLTVFAPRSVVRPADPLLYLVPQDRPLVILCRVAPINVDQVRIGQDVILRFTAFDSRNTPDLDGEVFQLSADAFNDERLGSYYRAQVRLRPGEIDKLPAGTKLVPGMPVEAFIRTGDRTPMEYLFKPIGDYFNRSFREG